jgi:hypothetical protein
MLFEPIPKTRIILYCTTVEKGKQIAQVDGICGQGAQVAYVGRHFEAFGAITKSYVFTPVCRHKSCRVFLSVFCSWFSVLLPIPETLVGREGVRSCRYSPFSC